MKPRIDISKYVNSGMGRAMLNLSSEVSAQIEPRLFFLVEIRASQINGCVYCLDMHTKDARAAGETEQRIYALNAWRETRVLQRPGACRARVDRSRDANRRHPRAGRGLRASGRAVRRGRTRGADLRGGRDQQLESPGDASARWSEYQTEASSRNGVRRVSDLPWSADALHDLRCVEVRAHAGVGQGAANTIDRGARLRGEFIAAVETSQHVERQQEERRIGDGCRRSAAHAAHR